MTLGFIGTLSPIHWLVVGILMLLFFGNRLPEVARSFGRSINEFKKGMREVHDEIDSDDDPPKRKLKPPADEDRHDDRVSREDQRETEHAESRRED